MTLPMAKEISPITSIPLRRMIQAELDAFLEKATDILRGSVDHSEFRGYVFALLFFKRISDIFEEAVRRPGDAERSHCPLSCRRIRPGRS